MRSRLSVVLLCLTLGPSGAGCRKPKPAPEAPAGPTYVPHGLQLSVAAAADLNQSDGLPHALMLVVYQLSTTNAFNTLAKDSAGVQTLLRASRFDASVASADRIFLQPGDKTKVFLDQAQSGS